MSDERLRHYVEEVLPGNGAIGFFAYSVGCQRARPPDEGATDAAIKSDRLKAQ
jgi:hypothetical protein